MRFSLVKSIATTIKAIPGPVAVHVANASPAKVRLADATLHDRFFADHPSGRSSGLVGAAVLDNNATSYTDGHDRLATPNRIVVMGRSEVCLITEDLQAEFTLESHRKVRDRSAHIYGQDSFPYQLQKADNHGAFVFVVVRGTADDFSRTLQAPRRLDEQVTFAFVGAFVR